MSYNPSGKFQEAIRTDPVRIIERYVSLTTTMTPILKESGVRLKVYISNGLDATVFVQRTKSPLTSPFRFTIPPRGGLLELSLFEDGLLVNQAWSASATVDGSTIHIIELERIASGEVGED